MTEDGVVINRFVNNRFMPTNAGQLKYKGFETGAAWTPKQNVTAYANGAFYRNRYGEFVIESSQWKHRVDGQPPGIVSRLHRELGRQRAACPVGQPDLRREARQLDVWQREQHGQDRRIHARRRRRDLAANVNRRTIANDAEGRKPLRACPLKRRGPRGILLNPDVLVPTTSTRIDQPGPVVARACHARRCDPRRSRRSSLRYGSWKGDAR